ncbi:MAG: outer membrane beta-barrel protein [Verrucomicrobia bacterium]|nr:outer membrane beta-barrel protein [Verrucomicrobiota bacterium]
MKRAVVAAGAFALGAAGLYGASVTDALTAQEKDKRWLLSGSLRNFFDDNMFNSPSVTAESSFGVEVKPGIALNLPLERTLLTASYDYTMSFFEARNDNKVDQTHQFEGRLDHKFSERYELSVTENFVVSDEPVVSSGPQNVFRSRADASNTRNTFGVEATILTKPTFGWLLGYGQYWQDYSTSEYSMTLDQSTHRANIDARWFSGESTLLFTGYLIGITEYTYARFLAWDQGQQVFASIKNNSFHRFYFGARHKLSSQTDLSGRVGFQYTDYFNQSESDISPYVDGSVSYKYSQNSTVSLGANVERYAADVTGALDQLIASGYLSVAHRITPRITGSADFRFQRATFNGGGTIDGESDNYYTMTFGAEYRFREYLSATLSYAWSRLSSGRGSSDFINFSRNQVYWGIKLSY